MTLHTKPAYRPLPSIKASPAPILCGGGGRVAAVVEVLHRGFLLIPEKTCLSWGISKGLFCFRATLWWPIRA